MAGRTAAYILKTPVRKFFWFVKPAMAIFVVFFVSQGFRLHFLRDKYISVFHDKD